MNCPRCQRELPNGSSSCPACGFSFDDATRQLERPTTPANKSGDERSLNSFQSIDDARFIPGAMLIGRYRIVGLLGRGGMGEVYRADDLKLGQPVALKFLPDHLLSDGAALARFHREVRVARQVSHKNVCRVYDIGEVDGCHFLSMEFIKGEELSSLLHRIGRLPEDKAIQIARQVCAGLAAAHDAGVLHRDLKPANIMIDEHGNARITDFGLAGLEEELRAEDAIAGTPAYMAPEQLEGRPFTLQSDVYSLGLLLYELFTARKAFDAPTLRELIKLRRSDSKPATPSSIVKDLDPLIEKIIDRCLQHDPDKRPASALQVAAALPGGDPLAAALAAGETPSPEMVAAAPKRGVLKPAVAGALLLSFIALLVLCAWLTKYTAVYRIAPMGDSPEVLQARAREVIRRLGYTEPANDSAYAVVFKADFVKYIAAHDQSANRWSKLSGGGGVYRFMYRETPRYFTPYLEDIDAQTPALDVSGMTLVYLDMLGHLHWFVGVPPQREPPAEAVQRNVDWSVPFREAGLDIAGFEPVASTYVPLHAYDVRAAWDGSDPNQPDVKLHVEGAAFRGRPVYFETVYPWDSPTRQELPPLAPGERVLDAILLSVFALALIGGALLARRNLRLGRGDRRGATRIAFFSCGTFVVLRMLADHHTGVLVYEFGLFTTELAFGLFGAVFLWLIYVALEPFVRRQWPDRIVSWSRLLAGGFRDPLVGRDVLVGSVAGAASILFSILAFVGLSWIGRPPELTVNLANLDLGSMHFATRFVGQIYASLLEGLIFLFLLLLFFLVLRRERLALIALWLFLIAPISLVNQINARMLLFTALVAALQVIVLARYGLLATIVAVFVVYLWVFYPMTTDLTAWYATNFLIDAAICLALAVFGFYTSLAGQPLFGRKLLE